MIRVLLVEDDRGYSRFLREILLEAKDAEFELSCAATLNDALQLLRESLFDIVLLDLGLPDADGTDALTQVAVAAPASPIVVLSSHDGLDVALESMRLGAQEYLVKGQAEHELLPRAIRYAMERKKLQVIAAAARDEAQRANAVKDDFLAMLGHELRNPLAPIVTALTLIRRHEHPKIEHELTIVDRQVQHLVRLVDDLLDVARIVRGKMALDRGVVDLADIVATGVEVASVLIDERRHQLRVDVPRGELFVDGDAARLGQVVTNLLTNAAKYTEPHGTIWVSARLDAGDVELRVRDTGIGMSQELLDRVFELFEQGPRSIDRPAGGLGLGLAIVRNLVSLHGGTVSAASEGLGKGSEIVVRFHGVPAPAAVEDTTVNVKEQPALAQAAGSRRVLVVDDNVDNAEMLDAGLTMLGHVTCLAHDGQSAVDAATEFAPDVALLDIGLPVLDGYEAARRIRANLGEATPVLVALTGYGQVSDRERSREAGFDEHLVKPINLESLQRLIVGTRARVTTS